MEKVKYQHGDLLLKEIKSIPAGAKKISIGESFIIEKGEGVHTHLLETKGVEVYEKEGTLFVKTGNKKVELTHEEHGKQVLEPNRIYRKEIEREFDYENMEARNTQD